MNKRYKSKRSNATDFSLDVKKEMLERDNYKCIFCSTGNGLTPAHYIPRSSGGLGIIENGVCLCVSCHQALDNSPARFHLKTKVKRYLKRHYPEFNPEDRYYKKGM